MKWLLLVLTMVFASGCLQPEVPVQKKEVKPCPVPPKPILEEFTTDDPRTSNKEFEKLIVNYGYLWIYAIEQSKTIECFTSRYGEK